jgi:F-box-like
VYVHNVFAPTSEADGLRPDRPLDRVGHVTMLPDEVLLNVFDFYRLDTMDSVGYTWAWHNLVHVCRRWRSVIFASPHHLSLRLVCKSRTPVRKTLDAWPALPIGIQAHPIHEDEDNIVAALEHSDRVSRIELSGLTGFQLERCASVMQEQFPPLTFLWLELYDPIAPVLTDAFLGGSAPRLRTVLLNGIPFPTLPRLLLTSSDLVNIQLWNIPVTGYFSPEVLAICLSALTRLESLSIEFQSPRSTPDRTNRHPPPLTPAVLPALTRLYFQGVSEYLEDLVARINAPLVSHVMITFFNQLVFDIPQLPQFIDRTEKLMPLNRAAVTFRPHTVGITLYSTTGPAKLDLQISCRESDWQISSMEQICIQCSLLLSRVERLEVHEGSFLRPQWLDDMDSAQWLELFIPWTSVQSLHVSEELQPLVAPALQDLTGRRAAEVLPALRTLFLEGLQHGSMSGSIEPFIAARKLSDHPVAVLRWDR